MKYSLDTLAVREVMPGFHGRFVHSDTMTFATWRVEAGARLPAHAHPHEQVVNMLEGTFDLVVDGATHRLVAGDIFPIPGNSLHSGEAITDCRILDVFSPVREDYRAG